MDWITLALQFGTEVLKKTPNYDDIKYRKFINLKKAYAQEIVKKYPDRDDDRILNMQEELKLYLSEKYEVIYGKKS